MTPNEPHADIGTRHGAEEPQGLASFREMFARLDEDSVKRLVRAVYGPNAYYSDTLKELCGVEAIQAYLIKTTRKISSITTTFDDVVPSSDGYYVRWTMTVRRKWRTDEPITSSGMTHLRFDDEGRVVYQQEYWDPIAGLFEHLPVVGTFMRMIKSRV